MIDQPSHMRPAPQPSAQVGLAALRAMLADHLNPIAALGVFHRTLGDVFMPKLGAFAPVILVGPKACRWVLTDAREQMLWRIEPQPITTLLGDGLLVADGPVHDQMRDFMGIGADAALHMQQVRGYADDFAWGARAVVEGWADGETRDLLIEVRRMALLGLMRALFAVDFTPHMDRLWKPILTLMAYISPGAWLVWPRVPNFTMPPARHAVDAYWMGIIAQRRAEMKADPDHPSGDMLSAFIRAGHPDTMIRDQLMTMLTAGHDTTTAALAWLFAMLAEHADARARLHAEIDGLPARSAFDMSQRQHAPFLEAVYLETLRLFPPAHMGGRIAAADLAFDGVRIAAGTRVFYAIYLTQRDPRVWGSDADRFMPDRVRTQPDLFRPYTYLPFGGGRRNCIGKPFADLMSRVIVTEVLSRYTFTPAGPPPHLHMGATIEPRPGVRVRLTRRAGGRTA
jgi:cytochrome P450